MWKGCGCGMNVDLMWTSCGRNVDGSGQNETGHWTRALRWSGRPISVMHRCAVSPRHPGKQTHRHTDCRSNSAASRIAIVSARPSVFRGLPQPGGPRHTQTDTHTSWPCARTAPETAHLMRIYGPEVPMISAGMACGYGMRRKQGQCTHATEVPPRRSCGTNSFGPGRGRRRSPSCCSCCDSAGIADRGADRRPK